MESKKRTRLLKNEVARLFNTSRETLRHYEDCGLITPDLDENNYRLYDVGDIKQLRKIFMFKDLDIPLEEIRGIVDGSVSKEEYLKLMDDHRKKLKLTIARYEETLKNVEQVMELLDESQEGISFKLTNYPKRYFITFNPFETGVLDSLKTYYDYFKEYIESPYYCERELLSLFKYDSLSEFDIKESQICLYLDKESLDYVKEPSSLNIKTLDEGTYLSVFYIFEEGKFDKLKDVKLIIDEYMKSNNLKLAQEDVIEAEHPELSTHLSSESSLYEIQVKVERVEQDK